MLPVPTVRARFALYASSAAGDTPRPKAARAARSLATSDVTAAARADEARWRSEHDAGWRAYQEGRLEEAARALKAAAREARSFKADDPCMSTTLDHLAWVYLAQGKPADGEPLARWALSWREKARAEKRPGKTGTPIRLKNRR